LKEKGIETQADVQTCAVCWHSGVLVCSQTKPKKKNVYHLKSKYTNKNKKTVHLTKHSLGSFDPSLGKERVENLFTASAIFFFDSMGFYMSLSAVFRA